jgi:hypothetical protein
MTSPRRQPSHGVEDHRTGISGGGLPSLRVLDAPKGGHGRFDSYDEASQKGAPSEPSLWCQAKSYAGLRMSSGCQYSGGG